MKHKRAKTLVYFTGEEQSNFLTTYNLLILKGCPTFNVSDYRKDSAREEGLSVPVRGQGFFNRVTTVKTLIHSSTE